MDFHRTLRFPFTDFEQTYTRPVGRSLHWVTGVDRPFICPGSLNVLSLQHTRKIFQDEKVPRKSVKPVQSLQKQNELSLSSQALG